MKAKQQTNKKIFVGQVLTGFVGVLMLFTAGMKISHQPQIVENLGHLGWAESQLVLLTAIEVICILFYLVPSTSVLGAVLLTGYLGGAAATHVRVNEWEALFPIFIGVLGWLGLFLRDERLTELLPVRGKDFVYVREIVVNRPATEVFAHLKLLNNFRNWNPFFRKDPQVKMESRGTDGEVGYVSMWNGSGEVGSGEQEITRIIEGDRIEFELRFKKPFAANNRAYFATEAMGANQTRVRWSMMGKTFFPMSLLGLFINFEKMIGKEFEWGLTRLKSIIEK